MRTIERVEVGKDLFVNILDALLFDDDSIIVQSCDIAIIAMQVDT
jgi:hypothetical protein